VPPPPTDETCLEKIDRISSTIKTSRNEITEILYSDISPEEKIIRSMEITREAVQTAQLYKECEESEDACKPEIAELMAKCKAGLIDYQANVNTIKFEKFATDMKNEQEFLNGLQNQLVPWMNEAEVTANKALEKPTGFENAREIEKQCVMFAKDVRKANKLLGKIDEASKRLARYQTTAEQQIEEQRVRFKKIASVAASRVESMRDLLIRWDKEPHVNVITLSYMSTYYIILHVNIITLYDMSYFLHYLTCQHHYILSQINIFKFSNNSTLLHSITGQHYYSLLIKQY